MTGESTFKKAYIAGLAAVVSTAATQPQDYIKVHAQLASQNHAGFVLQPWVYGRSAIAEAGFSQLWTGLNAALGRAVVTSGVRASLYGPAIAAAAASDRYHSVSMADRTYISAKVGAIAAFIASPFDLVLVRMQTDSLLAPELRRNYQGVFDGLYKIMQESNYGGLWVGALPSVLRASALTFGMMAPYDLMRDWLARCAGDVIGIKFYSIVWASLFGCALSYPFDLIKTRLMFQVEVAGKFPYRGFRDCVAKTYIRESSWGFYSGFWSYYFRVMPAATITFITVDLLQSLLCTDSV